MKLNNNALQELYDTIVNCTITISPYVDSPVYKAFKECDEKLSGSVIFAHIKKLQNDNDILKRANEDLRSANMRGLSKERKLEKEIDGLQKHIDILSASEREALSVNKKLEKDLADAKNQLHYFTNSRDDWRSRAKHAEDEIDGLKNKVERLEKEDKWLKDTSLTWSKKALERSKQINELKETLEKANTDRTELQKDRDSYCELYTELRKDYDKLFEDNKKLKARTDCHRYEVEWYRKHYKEQSDKIKELKKQLEELTSQYQKLTIENKRLQNSVRSGYDQGQTDLWVKLHNVNDSQPFELATCFPDVTGMEDILNWDLEDFLDAYKKWQEEKEKERLDHMRDYLARFCEGRVCEGCPLESNEYKCGCGYSFKKAADWDMKIIPDEELERYYNKAWHGDADCMKETRKRVKAACDAFIEGLKAGLASDVKEVPVSCDIPIKDLASWECTIEATVEVDKDLLNKVCGVKPEEKEHKLEYGDAVRVPWRDYDYMYIRPDKRGDGKMIRLFDPKNHSVAYVSSNEHLDIRGYKIIIGNEEDLRKIWCDKE